MRVVVLGGSGFLGTALVDELVSRGRDVVAVDRVEPRRNLADTVEHRGVDIRDRAALAEVVAGADEIYHLAGALGTSELDGQIRRSIETNVLGSLNVFEAAVEAHVPRVFFASKVHVWLNAYTITKHAAEQLGRLVSHQSSVRISSLRYLNMFGPGQKLAPVRKVLPTFAAQAMRGLPIQVFGDGNQTVDMLFVRDAARLTVDFLEAGFVDYAVDCGTGSAMTVNALAVAVNEYFDNHAGIDHVAMRRGETGVTQLVADTEPLQKIIGSLEFSDWQSALDESLAWYARLDAHEIDSALAFHGLAQPFDGSWRF
jgi:UDP-glucose 4-epimerase